MFTWIENRLALVGIIGSLLLHALIFRWLDITILPSPVEFTVKQGNFSTEIQLSSEPDTPVPTPAPALPTPEPTPPPTVASPAPVPNPPTVPPTHPVLQPQRSTQKNKPTKPSEKPVTHAVVHETPPETKGATQPAPDETQNDAPEYPEESKAAHEEGLVILRVEVGETGSALSVSIQKSSGYFRLDQAAKRAVQRWKFHPGTALGLPIRAEVDVPVRFVLR